MRHPAPRTLLYAIVTGLWVLALNLSVDHLTPGGPRSLEVHLVVAAAAGLLAFFFLSRELQVRRNAEEMLRQAHDESRVRIQEQAAELAQADKTLQAEIAARKGAQRAQQETQEGYRQLIELSPASIGVQVEGKVVFINAAGAHLLGAAAPEQLVGKSIIELIHPDQWPVVGERLEQVVERRQPVRLTEGKWIRLDGAVIDVEMTVIPAIHQNKPAAQVVAYDITARKRAEAALERRAQEMAALYATSLEINSQLDLSKLLHAIVQRATELLQVQVGELYLTKPNGQALEVMVGHHAPENRIGVTLNLGEGLAGRVAQSGDPLMVEDYHNWEGRAAVFADSPFRRMLGVPLKVRDKVIGVINVTDEHRTGPFEEHQVRLLGLFAAQAALAIENSRLYQAEREQRELAETLREAGATLASTLDTNTILERLLDQVGRVLPNDAASIMLIKNARAHAVRWRGHEQLGISDLAQSDYLIADSQYLKQILVTGEPVVVPDTGADPHWVGAPGTEWLRSVAAAPIRVGGQVIGFLIVASARAGLFGPAQAEQLLAFADQAAIALKNAQLYEQAQESASRLQAISHQLLKAQETERRSIARELHDEIGQTLTAVKINLQAMQRSSDMCAHASILEENISIIERTLQQVRNLSLDLRPSLLDDLGLVPALRWYTSRQAERTGFTAVLAADSLEAHLPPDVETVCFRVVQEALTNVARHAQAQHVLVELRQRDAELELTIRDDGVGFDVRSALERASHGASLGLRGMEERVTLVGGQMEIESVPSHGTEIRARFPLVSPARRAEGAPGG